MTTQLDAATGNRQSLLRRINHSRTLILMCLPAIVFFLVFAYAPMPGSWIAFTNFNYRDGGPYPRNLDTGFMRLVRW